MAYTPEQRRVIARIKQIGRQVGATPKEIKAALETGRVEANFTNPSGGDADSAGWRQERASIYRDPTNLDASIRRYFQETRAVRGKYGTAGDLAAAVQRPAAQYRGRYQQNSAEAQRLLGGSTPGSSGGGSAPASTRASSFGGSTRTTTTITPGVDNRMARASLISSFLEDHNANPVDFAVQANALKDIAPTSTTRTVRTASGAPSGAAGGRPATASFSTPKLQSGVANFEGKKVAAWIAPALQYARRHGWQGQVTSGYRSFADQTRIYNSGVRPAARPGTSNHEGTTFPRGAVDVSDAATLSRILARSPYGGRLKWAGAKDPPHFSHPHGGSY